MLAILTACDVTVDEQKTRQQLVGMIVTETDLYLTLYNSSIEDDLEMVCYQHQQMSNLVDVERVDDRNCRINFLDENQDRCEMWTCAFETDTCADSTMSAISQSWEKLFGVPLWENDAAAAAVQKIM